MRLSLPRLKMPRLPGFSILVWISTALKGWVMGSREKDTDSLIMYVTVKEGGPRMIVTGYSSGMVECRWYDGYGVKREAFHETELVPGEGSRSAEEV